MVLLWMPASGFVSTRLLDTLTSAPKKRSSRHSSHRITAMGIATLTTFSTLLTLHHKVSSCLTHHCVSSLRTHQRQKRLLFALFATSHLQGSRTEVFYWRSYSDLIGSMAYKQQIIESFSSNLHWQFVQVSCFLAVLLDLDELSYNSLNLDLRYHSYT